MATYALQQNGETINNIVLNNINDWLIPDGCELVLLPEPEPVPTDIAALKEQRLVELAAYRYQKETAGITLNGMQIRTDETSQAKINGAWATSQVNPAVLIDFKGVNGWVKINATEIAAIAITVSTYVQNCYTVERLHSDAIAALETSEEVATYDLTTGWPNG